MQAPIDFIYSFCPSLVRFGPSKLGLNSCNCLIRALQPCLEHGLIAPNYLFHAPSASLHSPKIKRNIIMCASKVQNTRDNIEAFQKRRIQCGTGSFSDLRKVLFAFSLISSPVSISYNSICAAEVLRPSVCAMCAPLTSFQHQLSSYTSAAYRDSPYSGKSLSMSPRRSQHDAHERSLSCAAPIVPLLPVLNLFLLY